MGEVDDMKIALLHGAKINAGDFLIKKRTEELLKFFYPKALIFEYFRNESIEQYMNQINECDIVILAGGPLLIKGLKNFPLLSEYKKIKRPIIALGLGWFGQDSSVDHVYGYMLNEETKNLISKCSKYSFIGCRDYYSVDILRNIGIDKTKMTGCPAWYYLPEIWNDDLKFSGLKNVKKICISDAARVDDKGVELSIIEFVRKFFGEDIEIAYVMHRDDWLEFDEFKHELAKYNVNMQYISNSEDGFSIYDDCDIHIGFRVHAHIYNLSKRKYSILIEEDGRGNGVDDTLGLPRIKAYKTVMVNNEIHKVPNNLAKYQLEDCIMDYEFNDYIRLRNAFKLMAQYFNVMSDFIKSIELYKGEK